MSQHEPTRVATHDATPLAQQLTVVDRLLRAEAAQSSSLEGPRLLQETGDTITTTALQNDLVVGRGQAATLRIDDEDLSREHFRIIRKGEDCFLYDLGSTNGTHVNASRVEHRALVAGDLIYVGQQVFLFMD